MSENPKERQDGLCLTCRTSREVSYVQRQELFCSKVVRYINRSNVELTGSGYFASRAQEFRQGQSYKYAVTSTSVFNVFRVGKYGRKQVGKYIYDL